MNHLGVSIFLLERGVNLKKRVDVEMGACHYFLLLYSSIIFTLCLGKVKFPLLPFGSFGRELTLQDSHQHLYSTKAVHHLYISDPFW